MQQQAWAHALEQAFRLLAAADPAARQAFDRVYRDASAGGDAVTQWLCAAGQMLSVAIDFADFRGLATWLARFEGGCPLSDRITSELDRLRIDSAWVTWASLDHRVAHEEPGPQAAAERMRVALMSDMPLSPDERLLHFKMLVDHNSQLHDVQTIARLCAFAQEYLQRADVSPEWQGIWWCQMTLNHEYWGDTVAAREAFDRALALADAHDLKRLRFELMCIEMNAALKADDLARCERIFGELDRLRPAVRAGRVPQGLRAQALYLVRKGEIGAALERCDLLLAICADVEVPERDRGAYWVLRSYCLTGLNRHAEALQTLASIRSQQKGSQGEVLQVVETLSHAAGLLDCDVAAARPLIAQALHAAVRLKFNRFLLPLPALAARICEIALDDGVETEFVTAAVRERRLVPADPAREEWPWRLRLYGLSELRILRDGEPLRTGGAKAPKKPLELLGALVAHGGEAVDIEVLVDALWPSLDANAPKASFEMALSRLRKLLDLPDAVLVADGSVCLNRSLVWCDVFAFERLADRLAKPAQGAAAEAERDALAERALALYLDRLLGSEELSGRLLALRERLALKFTRLTIDQGARLQARGDWRGAVVLYERALARDMLCEPLYRELMRAHLQLGERAEALRSFRRCRELLSGVLGSAPAAETLALYREISEGA